MANVGALVIVNGEMVPLTAGDHIVDADGNYAGGHPNQVISDSAATSAGQLVTAGGADRSIQYDDATTGILKVTSGVPSAATAGVDYITADTTNTLTNKSIDATTNTLTNIGLGSWETGLFDTDGTMTANSDTKVASQKAIRTYMESVRAGMKWKESVDVATTENGAYATAFANGQIVDGVTLVTGMRILIKDQISKNENGIHVVNASGAPTHATDFDTEAKIISSAVFVSQGSNGDTAWVCITDSPITVGSADLDFSQFYGVGNYVQGYGITLSGREFSIDTATTVDLTTAQTMTNKTLTSPVLDGTISGTSIKDEDDMASDSESHLVTQQSVKAYVDSKQRPIILNKTFFMDGINQLTNATFINMPIAYDAYITAISISSSAAFTPTKTLDVKPHINGTGVTPTSLNLRLDDNPTNSDTKISPWGTAGFQVTAGDTVGILVNTVAVDFTSTIEVSLALKIDPDQ